MIRILTTCMLGFGITLSGCATYSTDECSSGDWNKIGMQDGNDGRTADRFKQHGKSCKLDRSEESRSLYLAGRQKGLASYCTTVRGYREGALAQKYNGVCPAGSAKLFLTGYQLGNRIHQMELKISNANDAYFEVSQKLQDSSLPEAERVRLQQEQVRIQGEETRLGAELKRLRIKADTMVREARKQEKP